MGHHCNSYGFVGGFAAIFSGIAWFLVQDRACKINIQNVLSDTFNTDHLQLFHYTAIIVGTVLFVLSFFDFAGILYEVAILFYVAVVAVLAVGVAMFYATWMSFNMSCKSALGSSFLDTASLLGRKNVIEANDEVGVAITVLDLLAACLLLSAAISFGRRY